MAKSVKTATRVTCDIRPGEDKSISGPALGTISVDGVVIDSIFKAFDFFLQRQGWDRDAREVAIDALKNDAKNIANKSQKKFVVSLEG